MKQAVTVAVVDDHPLFRDGVTSALSTLGFQIVGTGSSREDAVALAERETPDIMLLDIAMPGGGLEAVAPIVANNESQKIVFLTVSESSHDAARALNSGAKGYVLKGVGAKSLGEILRSVANGEIYVSPTLAAKMFTDLQALSKKPALSEPLQTLTPRELEILALVSDGLSNKRVALHLEIQEKTVKYHMTKVLEKLGVLNRTAAAILYREARPT